MPAPDRVDLAVIGAGPAGMAAALCASDAGADVVLLDEHARPGGAVWRGLDGVKHHALARDYSVGLSMLNRFSAMEMTNYLCNARVWEVTRDRVITYSLDGTARQIAARHIILATGALERPMPFPGWTLPGVMTAGAAQIMLKSSRLTPSGPVVMAGCGPLLYRVATQLFRVGHPPVAIIDTTPKCNWRRALRHLSLDSRLWSQIATGVGWQRQLRRAGVTIFRRASDMRALGESQLTGLEFRVRGQSKTLNCSTLLMHAGLVPNTQITRALGLEHDWNETTQAWNPRTDQEGRTALDGVFVAGDGARTIGAVAAVHSGRLAALAALEGPEQELRQEQKALARHRANHGFLDAVFAPAREFLTPDDTTIVCRCEYVTAGEIRGLVRQGYHDPNAVKSICRAGMGPCQGRFCGLTLAHLVAEERGISPAEAGYFRIRSPIGPVTLSELADLQTGAVDDGSK